MRKSKYILPPREFAKRVLKYSFYSFGLLAFSLGLGVFGYHFIADLTWLDSIYNASMILTGMGPVATLTTDASKLFASFYAVFSGVIFLSTVAVFFAPFAHRLMHLLKIDGIDDQD